MKGGAMPLHRILVTYTGADDPERVISRIKALLSGMATAEIVEPDPLQKRADEMHAADVAEDYNLGRQ